MLGRRAIAFWLGAAACAAAAAPVAAGAGWDAVPGPGPVPVPSATVAPLKVAPRVGGVHSRFTVSFTAGAVGASTHYLVSAARPARAGCTSRAGVAVAAPAQPGLLRVTLAPRSGAGHWCRGTYRGRVVVIRMPACLARAIVCPEFAAVAATVGRFRFHVR